MKLTLYHIDAFTSQVFKGNPAAVCFLSNWLDEKLMQDISTENNLSETAFIVPHEDQYIIRWFTPTTEVDLCGHATLAAAHVLYEHLNYQKPEINFLSPRSGVLPVKKSEPFITLDFPADHFTALDPSLPLTTALGNSPQRIYMGKSDLMAIYKSEEEIRNINPDFKLLSLMECRGVIVSASGNNCDFVSRFFAPQSGIEEDPVTGSAHTLLTPFWADKLGKDTLIAKQLSNRGGDLICTLAGDRVHIAGQAKTYMIGDIFI